MGFICGTRNPILLNGVHQEKCSYLSRGRPLFGMVLRGKALTETGLGSEWGSGAAMDNRGSRATCGSIYYKYIYDDVYHFSAY